MQVIGAGLGRTGTLSLKIALEELGFGPCYHMQEVVLRHPEHVATWLAALHGRPVDWQTFFQPYQATVDYPACNYYQALMRVYPEAKVILTVRDPEKWYESAYHTIYAISQVVPPWLQYISPQRAKLSEMISEQIWHRQFPNFADRAQAIAIFKQYNEAVKQYVPPERLLVFEVKQGWAPLCQFLGVPVPRDKPFPHLNDAAEFRRRVQLLRLVRWLAPLAAIVSLVASVALVRYWLRHNSD